MNEDVTNYLAGLKPKAEAIQALIAGSKLNPQELATLALIQGYLEAAAYYVPLKNDISSFIAQGNMPSPKS